jgi:hypothetical protein
MSDFAKTLVPAAVFAAGFSSVACGTELWTRARKQREDTDSKETGYRTFWYAAAAGFVGLVMVFRGVQLTQD